MKLLEIKNLVVDYGIIRAIKGIDLSVEQGSIVAILGANGAGKTSTIRTINGLVKTKSGEIVFDGKKINNIDPHKLAKLGLIQSPEGRMILNGLSVQDNLLVGAYALPARLKEKLSSIKKDSTLSDEQKHQAISDAKAHYHKKTVLEEVYQYFPVLKERKGQQASTLSGGEQQMLAIGRALMNRPKLLLLDEPSLGLAPLIVKDIFKIIQKIKSQGITVLIVEQNAFQTLKIADYAYLLELGKIKTEGKASDLLNDDQLIKSYLGGK